MSNRVGQKLGHYQLIRLLGRGGFAEVYLGEHLYLKRYAALKILNAQLTSGDLQDFLKEAQAIASLKHPNIINVLDFGMDSAEQTPYLVMDYAPNGTLRQHHPKGSILPLSTVVAYIKQVAAALNYAHERKLIHCDIKPENLLLDDQNNMLLSDFGIAVIAHSTTSLKTQAYVGTVHYSAPEQIQGKPRIASDQYALAAVVYEWLTGKVLFDGGQHIAIAMQHLTATPEPLRARNPTISSEVEQVVLTALSKEPEKRFKNTLAFATALEQASQAKALTVGFAPISSVSPQNPGIFDPIYHHHNYGGSGVVTLAHLLGKEFVPVEGLWCNGIVTKGSQVIHVLLEVKPTELMAQVRMPLNFALVLDHSSSMKGAKLNSVKEAVKRVIDLLEPTDYISAVIFSDTAHVIIPSMPASDKSAMKAAIDRIGASGGRMMSLGMIQGLSELRRWNIPNAINRMILLTDGVPSDSNRCRQLARDAAAAGISIYPMGIGSDWDEDLLDDIGQLSGGMPAEFIQNPNDALNLFQQQVQSSVDVAIRNATLLLRLPAGVTPKKAVKVLPIIADLGPNVLSDRQVVIPLGDLEKDKPQSVLFELMIDPRPAGPFRIAQAELNYDVPITGLVGESLRDDVKVTFTNDANQAMQVNARVMNFVEIVEKLALPTGCATRDTFG